jgi:7-alpha-hydroxysteroid dehydrogenase
MEDFSMSVSGKSVIVTGGGTGIGAACARLLAEGGAAVTICGRTESKLAAIADEIRAAGGNVRHAVADVTVEDDVKRLVDESVVAFGGLHGFVANAGGGGRLSPYHQAGAAEFMRVLQLNLLGTMLSIKHAVPALAASRGSFVGMSSVAGHLTHLWFGAYPVAKAGIEAMIRNAADEYGAVGVRFNSVRPGFITTEVMEGVPRDSSVYASYIDNTPMGGVGEPADVALLVRFLLSDDSRWITGQEIGVDGGHTLRRGPDFTAFVGPAAAGLLRGEI